MDKGKEIIAVRNAACNEYGGINCEVQFEDAVNEKESRYGCRIPQRKRIIQNTEKPCGRG